MNTKLLRIRWHNFNSMMKESCIQDEIDRYYVKLAEKRAGIWPMLSNMFVYGIGILAIFGIVNAILQES